MKCNTCDGMLSSDMKAAIRNNLCPFCGEKVLSARIEYVISNIVEIIENNESIDAAILIVNKFISDDTKQLVEDVIDDIVVSLQPQLTQDEDYQPLISDQEDEPEDYMSDEERAEAEEAWRLMQEGNVDAFFAPDDDAPARPPPPPPPQLRSTEASVRSLQGVVTQAHRQLGGDIPEGFEDPRLLPQKGSSRISRVSS